MLHVVEKQCIKNVVKICVPVKLSSNDGKAGSGHMTLQSGNSAAGPTGLVKLASGTANQASGDISIASGASALASGDCVTQIKFNFSSIFVSIFYVPRTLLLSP